MGTMPPISSGRTLVKKYAEYLNRPNFPEFPGLTLENSTVIAPPSDEYNCLGDALHLNCWAGLPAELPDVNRILGFHGFDQDNFDLTVSPKRQKVILYLNSQNKVRHIIRQIRDGGFVSKNGDGFKIRIRDPEVLSNASYGSPRMVYSRTHERAKSALTSFWSTPIEQAGFASWVCETLKKIEISTLRDLMMSDKRYLAQIVKHRSDKFIGEINYTLDFWGLALRQSFPSDR